MKTIKKIKSYKAPPDQVFRYIDDLGVTGMHMTTSSMPMMGGKLDLEFLTPYRTGLHSSYRWTGKVLWWKMDFTVEVTKWIKDKVKTWQTIGNPQMIIYSWFQMNLHVAPTPNGSTAHLSITYKKPKGFFNKILCFLLGDWYCRWCLNNMLNDTEKRITYQTQDH